MAKKTSRKPTTVAKKAAAKPAAAKKRPQRARTPSASRPAPRIRFSATLHRPAGKAVAWTFLTLPKSASAKLPSRAQVSIEGTFNGEPLQATLEPDGAGGHWLKVDRKLRESAGAAPGDKVTLEIAPMAEEPEPKVPADLRRALAAAAPKARATWSDTTPLARRDWIQWITSGKKAETRTRRIATACDMLAKGKRRPCCFDRSGMYGKNLACPVPAADDDA